MITPLCQNRVTRPAHSIRLYTNKRGVAVLQEWRYSRTGAESETISLLDCDTLSLTGNAPSISCHVVDSMHELWILLPSPPFPFRLCRGALLGSLVSLQ